LNNIFKVTVKKSWYDLGGHVSSRDTCGTCDVGTRRLLQGGGQIVPIYFCILPKQDKTNQNRLYENVLFCFVLFYFVFKKMNNNSLYIQQ